MKAEKTTFFDFLTQVVSLFGIEVLILIVITLVVGKEAHATSPIFQFGGMGIAIETLLQFAFIAVMICIFRYLCMSDLLFKNMFILWRTVIMLFLILSMMVAGIIGFGWFPEGASEGWIYFIFAFILCFLISTGIFVLKTKMESRKYEDLLKKYQDEMEE